MHTLPPLIISVAPNGARKTKQDHPALPMTAPEIAREARHCMEAGALLLHLHVRDDNGGHSLSADKYREATKAVRAEVGDKMIIQITTEAVGIYTPEQQMQAVRDVRPEAVSLGLREIMPDESYEKAGAEFLEWVMRERIMPQYILYSEEDLIRFDTLVKRGVIPGDKHSVLYVLGRYSKNLTSSPMDLLPFLSRTKELGLFEDQARFLWSVCAFGAQEKMCMVTACGFGGHVRIGFENNLYLKEGMLADDNASLICNFLTAMSSASRKIAKIDEARQMLA